MTARAINKNNEKQQELFNQSQEIQMTPLVIYGLGGVHTQDMNIQTATQK